jgi:hypothetical protein
MSEPYDPNQWDWGHDHPGFQGQSPTTPYQAQPYQAQPYQAQPYQAQPYQAQPYGAPLYSIYPGPGAASHGRPGQVVAAAVLSYVEAGLLILTGLILFSGSAAASAWSSDGDGEHGWGAQFGFAGLGDIVAAGLLIAGGVMFTGGKRPGRTLLGFGLGLCVIEALFWIIRFDDGAGAMVPWAAFYLIMPTIAMFLSYAGSITGWLDARA